MYMIWVLLGMPIVFGLYALYCAAKDSHDRELHRSYSPRVHRRNIPLH